MRIVVGLGNPGPRYAGTRHNIGFQVVDRLAATGGGRWREAAGPSLTAALSRGGAEVLLVKPQTFMNRSGAAVAAVGRQVGFEPAEVLVVLDDFHLDFGRLRLRRSGSDGGHNGLASVLQELGSEAVPRLRVGIGWVPEGQEDIDFVLAPFGSAEDVDGLVERGCGATECWLTEGIEAAMNRFNGGPAL
ncbi:MAG: aminoacyl-tRNA hydrolase [Gemmatimonadota bacterium]